MMRRGPAAADHAEAGTSMVTVADVGRADRSVSRVSTPARRLSSAVGGLVEFGAFPYCGPEADGAVYYDRGIFEYKCSNSGEKVWHWERVY